MHSRETYPSTNSNWKSAVKSGLKKNFTPGVDFYFKKKGLQQFEHTCDVLYVYLRYFVCILTMFCMCTCDVLYVYLRCFVCVLAMPGFSGLQTHITVTYVYKGKTGVGIVSQ